MSLPERPRILVVDDEPEFLAGLAKTLTARGYECLTAGTVREATDHAGGRRPDLCLVGLKLPDGTGLDVIARVRGLSSETEFIILAGDALQPVSAEATGLGVYGYVEKTGNTDRLFLMLEKALERQHLVRTTQNSRTACSELLNAAGSVIFTIASSTWRLSDANPAFIDTLGYAPEESDLLTMGQLLPDSERVRVMKMLAGLGTAHPGQARNLMFETPLRRKDGTPRWFSIIATRLDRGVAPRPGERGTDAGEHGPESLTPPPAYDLLLVCNDTSVSRKALTELEQTRGLLDGVYAALPCGVAIVNNDFLVMDANAAYFTPLGLDRSQVRSRHCHEAFSDYAAPCAMFGESCPIAAARAAGGVGRVYREHRLPNGSIRYLEYTANPQVDAQGSVTAYVLVVNDLTAFHESESNLGHAKDALDDLNSALSTHQEEMAESTRRLELASVEVVRLGSARTQFVDAISQELRTPIAAISEGVGLVEDGSLGALNSDQQTFLRLAGKNTRRLTDVLNDLLDLSQIEAGKMEMHLHRLDLGRIAREVATTYDSITQCSRQTLKVDLPRGLEPALADEQSVLRILTNLVGNAVKFTPAGGSITISADRLPPDPDHPERPSQPGPGAVSHQRITVSVSDTGIGIPADQQRRIAGNAEPVAPSPAGAARPRGTGLGLALCRQLVEMNGGRFWLESEEGKGSHFHFTLPVYTEFAGLAADLRYYASVVADSRKGASAIYCFRVQPGKEGGAALPRLEELLESLFPKPAILFVTDSGCAILVLAPRRLPDRELASVIESLKDANLFVGRQKSGVRLLFGALDSDQLKLKLQSLPAGRPEPAADFAVQWWDTLFGELKPGLTEVR